jgi:predicted HTH domain antitoxin
MNVTFEELSRETGLSESELRLELAVRLFELERLTLGQASRLAGLAQFAFQRVLAERRIPVHYDEQDYEEDVRTLRELGRA